ncbi:MAG TPA: Ku protein [Solirubrobacterales bacterium]|nr:Ku protein [Solirubrobacterales bacterium]
MARAIWSGTISFGLLNVPVKLYSAVSRKTIRFNELRESDNARVRHKRVAEGTDEEVSYDEIVKGYELTKDRYVTFTREELAELDPAKTRTIEIQDFVDISDIDPIYFESPYYLGPAEGAEKAYSLLGEAMERSGKAAIARFVLRNREHLAAIRASGGVLTMTTMRFADEVVSPDELEDELPQDKPKVQKREVEMAERLIDSLTADFDPSQYRDEYREDLLSMIERKAQGKEVVAPTAEEPEPTKAPDLMAALEESIAAVSGSGGGKKSGRDGGGKSKAKPKSKSGTGSRSKPSSKSGAKSSSNGSGSKSRSKSTRSKSKSRS